ncbi:MAG: NAD(P)/FAD-dependent oxidoreductase [Deltaproteobacteria bacterium]|nr:NAD(P)/FAD-dependent oxidoreductase [Deltaproteobacteria bacterium]
MTRKYDVVVLGGGSAGEVVAGRLADAGLTVAVVESSLVGGACSYWACMPSKALLRPGAVISQARRVPGAAAAMSGSISLSQALQQRDRMASHWDDRRQEQWLEQHGVDLVRGRGRLDGERRVLVGGNLILEATRAVVVATGSEPIMVPVAGADEVDLWDNRAVTSADRAPRRMLIIGGGSVGVESGQAWYRLGSEQVTIVERAERLLSTEEAFAGAHLEQAFGDEGIEVMTGTDVLEMRRADEGAVEVCLSDESLRTVDVVVSAVGRRASTADIGLETIDLEPGEPIVVDSWLRSLEHNDWLFAVGDVNGREPLTHMGKYEARIAADQILGRGRDARSGRRAVPRVVFTDPIVAAVGMTEADAVESGLDVETRRVSISEQAEAALWGEDVEGAGLFVIDTEASCLVGATFTGPAPLAEMLLGAQVAIVGRVPLDTLRHVAPQFPTFSEVWLELVS